MASLIEDFALNNNSLIDPIDIFRKSLGLVEIEYFSNVIRYIDDYTFYNFLQIIDPNYGKNDSRLDDLNIEANVTLSFALILYYKKYGDDAEVIQQDLDVIKQQLKDGLINEIL
jgi:hypothetical protein